MKMNNTDQMKIAIEERLKEVYDPEFPMIDIFTLWLIYSVDIFDDKQKAIITMTFTTPACPMAETLKEMTKNAVLEILPDFEVDIQITFDPMRTIDMIKDDDLKRMFQ